MINLFHIKMNAKHSQLLHQISFCRSLAHPTPLTLYSSMGLAFGIVSKLNRLCVVL